MMSGSQYKRSRLSKQEKLKKTLNKTCIRTFQDLFIFSKRKLLEKHILAPPILIGYVSKSKPSLQLHGYLQYLLTTFPLE